MEKLGLFLAVDPVGARPALDPFAPLRAPADHRELDEAFAKAQSQLAEFEKAGRSMGKFFAKQVENLTTTHAFHAAVAAHHEAAAGAHKEYAAHLKATHDGMADDHELKAHFAKVHTHHTQMAAHYEAIAKAYADHGATMKASIDTLKALSSDWGAAPGPVSSVFKVGSTTLEMMDNDPEVQQYMRATVMKLFGEAIGNTVARPREPDEHILRVAKPNVSVQFQRLVTVDEEEENAWR